MTTASQTPTPPSDARPATPTAVRAAEGIIRAAMENGAATPEELAQAEHAAGILFDAQAAADIAAAAADQAHADDAIEIAERGRQLARMAGAARQRDAVMRLLEGRPGTDHISVAEIAAAVEYGSAPYDNLPMTLAWTDGVDVPGPGRAIVRCASPYGGLAHLVVEGADRARLAGLLADEARDASQPCPDTGCGEGHDWDPTNPFLAGWSRLEIATLGDGPRWYCSPQCVTDALTRAGEQLAAADRAAAVDPGQQGHSAPAGDGEEYPYGDPLAYGPSGIPCGCGKPAHSNLVPCRPDTPVDEEEAARRSVDRAFPAVAQFLRDENHQAATVGTDMPYGGDLLAEETRTFPEAALDGVDDRDPMGGAW